MITAENRLSMLAERSKSSHHIAAVTRSRITLYTTLDRSDRAVEVCLEYLRRRGTDWSLRPSRNEVMREYERVWSLLVGGRIEEVLDLPFVPYTYFLDLLDVFPQ